MRSVFLLFLSLAWLPGLASAAAPEVRASPARVVLGQDQVVEVEVRVSEEAGPVHAAASAGTFDTAAVEDGETRRFRWTPPDIRYPLAALLAFWVETPEGPPEVAFVRIPLVGRTTLPITTDPGAQVEIEIDGTRFGPVQANRRGRAQVPVEVPPGVKQARVLATRGTLKTDRVAPLETPPHRPLVAVLSPQPLPGQGGWLVVGAEGPTEAADLEVQSEGARVEHAGGPALLYRVKPNAGVEEVSVEVRRRRARDTAQARATVTAPEPVATLATPSPSTPPPRRGLALHLLAGGFFAGGANRGPSVALGVSHPLPFLGGRLSAEAEVGLRRAAMEARVEGLGTLRSHVLAGPVLASARMALLERAAFTLYGRAGVGVLPFQHEVSSDFQPGFGESKLGPLAFLAAQGAWRLGQMSALMEVRGEYGPAQTSRLDAQMGGVSATLGVRYEP